MSKTLNICTWGQWQDATHGNGRKECSFWLFTHPCVSLGKFDLELMLNVLASKPSGLAVIARAFDKDCPSRAINAGCWRDASTLQWNLLSMYEQLADTDKPLLAEPCQSSVGAVLIRREDALRVGYFDPRFATQLQEIEWIRRAERKGVTCVLVRNAKALTEVATYSNGLDDRYGMIRDGLLLERLHGRFWPAYFCRLLRYLVVELWRPFDFSLGGNCDNGYMRLWLWAIESYIRGLRLRMGSQESLDILCASRDFLLGRFRKVA